MNNTVTSDLSEFGNREKAIAAELLKIYSETGSDFLNEKVNIFLNKDSGNVFLSDEDFTVGMLYDDKLLQFFSCSNCGNESFAKEDADEEDHYPFKTYNGYCSKECQAKNE